MLQSNKKWISFLRLMQISRECDRREGLLLRQGKSLLLVPSAGHEALAVLAYHLEADDYLVMYYRDRPLMLARGFTPRQMARDFLGRATSSSGGRNMPLHVTDRSLNLFSVATPTGAQCLPAVGMAWGIKLAGTSDVVLCTIGDAAVRQGEFYEAVCLAIQEKLPVIFLVEDNAYGISTPTAKMLPFQLAVFAPELVTRVNGRDVLQLFAASQEGIQRAREGHGPTILWAEVDRLFSHTNADDQRVYRTPEELASIQKRDPIACFAQKLIDSGELTAEGWQKMQEEIAEQIDRIYQEVLEEPPPNPANVMDHLYAPPVTHAPIPFQPEAEETTMVAAINRTFHAAMAGNPKIVMFGQDIEDPKGGVFGLTKGLSRRFPERVVNSPLAEATIAGSAVGLAASGYLPVFEFQFTDFLTPAFHQLATQIATLRWRSNGEWSCPMVLYAPYGAYLPGGGLWHSQSNDGWWCHIPGLRVAIPSTPEDAVGLFWAAMEDQDPSLILLPKHIFRVRMRVTEYEPLPFGQAAIRRTGNDVTVVSWGNCLKLAHEAADYLAQEGISVEIIDLRTLVPCDWQTVANSLSKTGRLVVIHEDSRTCGFGQAVISEMTSHPEWFNYFFSPPQLVARDDVHMPYYPDLEYAVLPDFAKVLQAIYLTLE